MVILRASQEFSIPTFAIVVNFPLALEIELGIAIDTVDLKRAKKGLYRLPKSSLASDAQWCDYMYSNGHSKLAKCRRFSSLMHRLQIKKKKKHSIWSALRALLYPERAHVCLAFLVLFQLSKTNGSSIESFQAPLGLDSCRLKFLPGILWK